MAIETTIEFAINYVPSRDVQDDLILALSRMAGIGNVLFAQDVDGPRLKVVHTNRNSELTQMTLRNYIASIVPGLLESP